MALAVKKAMVVLGRIMLVASLLVIVAAVVGYAFNERILSSASSPLIRAVTFLLFEPEDFYDDLAIRRIEVAQPESGELTFIPKYRGHHKVGIILRGVTVDSALDVPRSLRLRITLRFSSSGRLHMSEEVGQGTHTLFQQGVREDPRKRSHKGRRHGFELFFFQVPEDLPVGEAITMKYEISEPDERIAAFGPIEIFVRKAWDL